MRTNYNHNNWFIRELDHLLPVSDTLVFLELLFTIIILIIKAPFRILWENPTYTLRDEDSNTQEEHSSATRSFSSSQRIMAALPPTRTRQQPPASHDLDDAVTASLNESYSTPQPVRINTDLSSYSVHTQQYLKSRLNQPTLQQQITTLIQLLAEKEETLTDAEANSLEPFKDVITQEFMAIPVSLNEKFYDLSTITRLTIDPNTRERFNLCEIQSARTLITAFDEVITNIKHAHGMSEHVFSP